MKKYLGMLGLLIVTVIWGGGFVASDIALSSLSPAQILVTRFLLASVLMFPLCARHLKSIKKQEIRAGIILGVYLFAAFALQIVGLKYTTPSKNAFLTATNVVFVPFIARVLYRKHVSVQGVIGAFMAIAGAGVLSLDKNFAIGLGDGLTLLCAVCFALHIFFTGEYVEKYRVTVLIFFQMVTAFAFSLFYLLITGGWGEFSMTREGILSVLYLGAVSTTLTYLIQTASQQYVDETRSAIILSMEAVFGTLFSVLLLHEKIDGKMVAGCILILGAVLVSEIKIMPLSRCEGDTA
ncbi:EamA-like transporter family protein [Clostridium sp. C105KSO15]|nr:EamA-like transporter family protein [Clostridium sp. C105KSO15]